MTSPEERAKAVVSEASGVSPLHLEVLGQQRRPDLLAMRVGSLQALIAQAIREAENDALERVSVLLDRLLGHFDGHTASEAAVLSGAVSELSARIRSLKTKD